MFANCIGPCVDVAAVEATCSPSKRLVCYACEVDRMAKSFGNVSSFRSGPEHICSLRSRDTPPVPHLRNMFPNRSHFANQQHDVVDNTTSMASKTISYQQNVSHFSGDGIERTKLKENLAEKLAAKKRQVRELNAQIKLHQCLEHQAKVRTWRARCSKE